MKQKENVGEGHRASETWSQHVVRSKEWSNYKGTYAVSSVSRPMIDKYDHLTIHNQSATLSMCHRLPQYIHIYSTYQQHGSQVEYLALAPNLKTFSGTLQLVCVLLQTLLSKRKETSRRRDNYLLSTALYCYTTSCASYCTVRHTSLTCQ